MSVHKQHKEAAHEMALRDVYHYGKDIVNTDIFKEAMAQAVANENYEFAARLRDEINSRSHSDETDSDLI